MQETPGLFTHVELMSFICGTHRSSLLRSFVATLQQRSAASLWAVNNPTAATIVIKLHKTNHPPWCSDELGASSLETEAGLSAVRLKKSIFSLMHTQCALYPHTVGTFPTAWKNFPKSDSNSFHLAQTTQSQVIFSTFHLLRVFGSLAISAGGGQYGESTIIWLSLPFDWLLFLICDIQQRQWVKVESSLQGSVRVSSFLLSPKDQSFSQVIAAYCSIMSKMRPLSLSGSLDGFSPGFKGCQKDADGPTGMMGKEVFP